MDQTRAARARSAPPRGSRSSARSARLIQECECSDFVLVFKKLKSTIFTFGGRLTIRTLARA